MNEHQPEFLDAALAHLDAALPPLLQAELNAPRWARALRRRLLRERWARRLEWIALALQAALIVAIVALFHPWTWRWPQGSTFALGLWTPALLMGLALAVAAAAAVWSLNGIGGSGR